MPSSDEPDRIVARLRALETTSPGESLPPVLYTAPVPVTPITGPTTAMDRSCGWYGRGEALPPCRFRACHVPDKGRSPRARATAFPVTTRSCPRSSIETENAAPSWTAGLTSPVHTGGHHGVQIAAGPPSICLGAGGAHAAHWSRARAGPGDGGGDGPAGHLVSGGRGAPNRLRRYRSAAYVGCTRGESLCTGFPSLP
jgi:hypothetical protein